MRLRFCLVVRVTRYTDWNLPIRFKVLASSEEVALKKCEDLRSSVQKTQDSRSTGIKYHYILGGCESRDEISNAFEMDKNYVDNMFNMRKIREIGMHSPRAQRLRTKLDLMKRRSFVL